MDYIVIFDFVLKSIAYLVGIVFCIYLIVFEIKTYKMKKKCIRKLRDIERSCNIEDENVKDFVHALIDEMEEQLTISYGRTSQTWTIADTKEQLPKIGDLIQE